MRALMGLCCVSLASACHWLAPYESTATSTQDAAALQDGGVDADAVASPDAAMSDAGETGGRVPSPLLLYLFDEGEGNVVRDRSGIGTAYDLTIQSSTSTSWSAGTLTLEVRTLITSSLPARKVIDACQSSNEVTLEAWVTPAEAEQAGPARIFALSAGYRSQNFLMGQGNCYIELAAKYCVRLRTSETSERGVPAMNTEDGTATADRTHLVFVRTEGGEEKLYKNNQLLEQRVQGGDLSTWEATHRLVIGDDLDGGGIRHWLGTLHLVAVYDRALSPDEVLQNFNAGADPELEGR